MLWSRRRAIAVVLATSTLAGCFGGSDDDDADDADGPDATLSAPQTFEQQVIDATIPGGTLPVDGSTPVEAALADETVTAEELTAAYDGYVACLADGGGVGRYAYDVELRTGLVVEWSADTSGDVDRDAVSARCSRRHLGDVARRFDVANPVGDVAERQRASIADCISAVSPEAAANLPAAIAIGTAGEATSLSELQLDPAALDPETLGSDPEDIAAVGSCIASVGTDWQSFG